MKILLVQMLLERVRIIMVSSVVLVLGFFPVYDFLPLDELFHYTAVHLTDLGLLINDPFHLLGELFEGLGSMEWLRHLLQCVRGV